MSAATLLPEPEVDSTMPWAEELLRLELRVARRADELSGRASSTRSRDLLLWFQAEREIMREENTGWITVAKAVDGAGDRA